MEKLKRNISSNAVALLLVSVMLLSSLTFTSSLIHAQGDNITFTSGTTMSFTSNTEMTITSDVSMRFGTGIQMQFIDMDGDGVLEPCDYIMVNPAIGYLPPYCSWWEVLDSQGNPTGYEFHVDGVIPPYEAHVDDTRYHGEPAPIPVPPGIVVAEKKIETIMPCDHFVVHWPQHWYPPECSWWELLDPYEGMPTGYEFHVDWTNESCEFHIDEVTPGSLIFPPPYYYELEARQKIIEIKPCDWFVVTDPQGFTPPLCSWWEILDPSGHPSGYEFHVDGLPGEPGKFHVDEVIPSPLILPWGPSYSLRVRQKIDIIQQCFNGKTDPVFIPDLLSWWKVINPSIGDVEFRVDSSNPGGTFHVDTSTQVAPFTPPVYMVTAERKIGNIMPCDSFSLYQGLLPGKCSWWRIISPTEWAGIIFHVDSNDGFNRFHVDDVQGQLPSIAIPPWQVTAEPYTPQPPSWYIKPPYPDYAPSGMPDFDERQDSWWWRSWAYPDAVAVWQHFSDQYNDWDIYYSIYTDPNIWWTLGTDYTRPIVSDSPMKMSFLPGDDKQPAISWYSSNYAIAVWQHWMGSDWDIWYSVFTPNVGWSIPAPVATNMGYNDYDPAIAFDKNGWATCVWVHGNQPAATNIYYSVWNPNTMNWIGPNTFLNAVSHGPGKAAMPEIDVDSNHKLVTIWTDTAGAAGTERVYFSWAAFNPPALPAWNAPAIVPGCPAGMNWQKGISPDTLGNNLMDWGLPAPSPPQEPLYYAKFVPGGVGWNPGATLFTNPNTNGEHPDLAYDFNNSAIAVYTQYPTGQIWYSFWNGVNWLPVGGKFAATSGFGPDQWPAVAFIKNNKAVLVWNAYPEPYGTQMRTEIYYSVYTPTYPADSWTQAKKIYEPNNPGLFLTGDDYYVDIASPTGSATTPVSVPPATPRPAEADIYWTWCAPLAVANSIWWFDSKYEPNTVPPPTISDGFSLVKSYNPGVWDDHDPQNVQPFVEHLAYLMDCDGMRTKLCHDGTTVWDMQAGITHYLSWSGVNPLGDVNGDGIVDLNDVNLVSAAMGSTPGTANWNLACDVYPETVTGPRTADNIINQSDLNLVIANFGKKGMFYEHTTDVYPDFYYIEGEVMKCQDVVLLLAFFQNGDRDGGHFVTVAGVNSTASQYQLLISNPIRDDFEGGGTPAGRSPVPHVHGLEPPYTTHNNASLVSQDAWTVRYNAAGGYWYLEGYFSDPTWEARIEFAVITSPTEWVHDIAVKDLKSSKPVVGKGFNCSLNVTVTNEGDFQETFDLTFYAETVPPPEIIDTITVTDLLVGETRSIIYNWNTSSFAKGNNYTISAYAWPVMGEIDTGDNRFTDDRVFISVVGDLGGGVPPQFFKCDGKCDGKDLSLFLQCFKGTAPPEAMYLGDLGGGVPPQFFKCDGKCDGKDLSLFLMCFKGQGPDP
jgi:hypothetical protein